MAGILYFTGKFSEIPPASERKESSHHTTRQRRDQRCCTCLARDEWSEVGPVAELKPDAPEKHERQQAEFEKRYCSYEAGAEFDAANVDERNDDDRRDRHHLEAGSGEFENVTGISRETDSE